MTPRSWDEGDWRALESLADLERERARDANPPLLLVAVVGVALTAVAVGIVVLAVWAVVALTG